MEGAALSLQLPAHPRHRRAPELSRSRVRRSVRATISAGLMLGLLVAVLPLVTSAPWADVLAALSGLSLAQLLLLAVIWFSGLCAHTFVLTAAMPPLTHRRALTLSLTGSAVSNLVPCGGAFGVGLNFAMSKAWGFSKPAFVLYTFVTNLWDTLTKLTMPALALGLLLLTDQVVRPQLATIAIMALGVLALVIALVVAALGSERVARGLGTALDAGARFLLDLIGSARRVDVRHAILDLRRESHALLRRGWAQLSLGMLAYSALQALLLWCCLHMLGTTLTAPQIFAGYAVERVLTFAVITPGGTGLVEVGITALLIAFGGDPITTVAGVLVYRAFTFGLEIPVGGVGLLVWLWRRRTHGKRVAGSRAAMSGQGA